MPANVLLLFAFLISLLPGRIWGQSKADSTAIQAIVEQQVMAWNAGDAQAYARSFARDGTFTNIQGSFWTGHQPFLERHEQIFKGFFKGTTLRQKIASLRFIEPSTAIVETVTSVSGFSASLPPGTRLDAAGRLVTRLVQVLVSSTDGWQIIVYHNVDVKPGIPVPELN